MSRSGELLTRIYDKMSFADTVIWISVEYIHSASGPYLLYTTGKGVNLHKENATVNPLKNSIRDDIIGVVAVHLSHLINGSSVTISQVVRQVDLFMQRNESHFAA